MSDAPRADDDAVASAAGPRPNPWSGPKRWVLAFVVPGVSLAVIAAVALALYVREYTGGMSPWPGPRAAPRAVVPPEVSGLGLKLLATSDASAGTYWASGHFDQGVMALYGVGVDTVAGVWALRYPSETQAKQDFEGSADWFTATSDAPAYVSADFQVPGAGIRAHGTRQAAEMTCLHRNWIVAVRVDGRYGIAPSALTRAVRDAIAAHWRTAARSAGS